MAYNLEKLNKHVKNIYMIHLVDSKLNKNHLSYWIEVFEKSEQNFSFLVRDEKSFGELIQLYPQHQILYASTPVDVETIVNAQPSLKVVFFPLNAAKNIHLLRFNHLKHIFIGTKHSDQLSVINKSYKAYDEIWVSSQSMVDKYNENFENLGHLQLKIVGKPQLKNVFLESEKMVQKDTIILNIANSNSLFVNQLSVLLLTLKSHHFSIFINDNTIFRRLKEFLQGYLLNSNLYLNNSMFDLLIAQSKYIITDVDNISIFYLAYNQPLIVYVPEDIEKDTLRLDIPHDALYLFSNKDEFLDIIENIDKDILKSKREYYAEYFLGKQATLDDEIYKKLKLLN